MLCKAYGVYEIQYGFVSLQARDNTAPARGSGLRVSKEHPLVLRHQVSLCSHGQLVDHSVVNVEWQIKAGIDWLHFVSVSEVVADVYLLGVCCDPGRALLYGSIPDRDEPLFRWCSGMMLRA